ncbi:hypothetical protein CkaCkLH20_04459 [Colletotrichum karsti]|uniref:FAD-binding PCMH-type domain-containing protein n=1 Tax=Colletotrichum karsti TaxID=1095194 RepID=A0A9P6I5X3_9PEZI|nr:uncharacterized protein CkaCkLH20_04459 [Colletotrichum karsti]KAF9877883.1 hypothetical protein CkaCkLH20_04459 [Colletotrichum karsti]
MKSFSVLTLLSLCLAQTAFAACRTRSTDCSPQSVCDAISKPGAFPCATTEQQSAAQCSQAATPGSDGGSVIASRLKEVGLGEQLVYPQESRYHEVVTPHWSLTAQLTPYCVVQPTTTEEVSKAVAVLAKVEGCIFAVRSGGHCVWPGSSNCDNGIVIDLGKLNGIEYDREKKVVKVQAGCRWRDVYRKAEDNGVTVSGGREGAVGVGGFLCGGGFSWLIPRSGFGCDTVVQFEVVLADGRIIQANSHENSDLFTALKGGSCNFGIVTRFDLETFPETQVWGGVNICHVSTSPKHIEYFVDYIDTIEEKADSSYGLVWAWEPRFKDVILTVMMSNTKGVVDPPALADVLEVPAMVSTVESRGVTEFALHMESPEKLYNLWRSATFSNDARILHKLVETHRDFVARLRERIPDDGFNTICFAQALPTLYAKRGQDRGGNVLGVENLGGNCISFLGAANVKDEQHVEFASGVLQDWYDSLIEYAKSIGVWKDWLYLNYSDKSQNPLQTYGQENVDKIRAAALKYDPKGVFQTKCPGGFKITKI